MTLIMATLKEIRDSPQGSGHEKDEGMKMKKYKKQIAASYPKWSRQHLRETLPKELSLILNFEFWKSSLPLRDRPHQFTFKFCLV